MRPAATFIVTLLAVTPVLSAPFILPTTGSKPLEHTLAKNRRGSAVTDADIDSLISAIGNHFRTNARDLTDEEFKMLACEMGKGAGVACVIASPRPPPSKPRRKNNAPQRRELTERDHQLTARVAMSRLYNQLLQGAVVGGVIAALTDGVSRTLHLGIPVVHTTNSSARNVRELLERDPDLIARAFPYKVLLDEFGKGGAIGAAFAGLTAAVTDLLHMNSKNSTTTSSTTATARDLTADQFNGIAQAMTIGELLKSFGNGPSELSNNIKFTEPFPPNLALQQTRELLEAMQMLAARGMNEID